MEQQKDGKNLDKRNVENLLPLTPIQQGILVEHVRDRYQHQYHEQLVLHMQGEVHEAAWVKAWEAVIQDNGALRTVFRWERLEQPVQIIMKKVTPSIEIVNLSDEPNPDKALASRIEQDRKQRFDLKQVPFRLQLFRFHPERSALLISHHHILYDGWSTGILLQEFAAHYRALLTGHVLASPRKPSLQSYLEWQQQQDREGQRRYWARYLADYEPKSILQERFIAEAAPQNGAVYSFVIDEQMAAQMKQFAAAHATPAITLLYAAWGIVLFQYCNSDDVTFGTTVAIRPDEIRHMEAMVGLLINTIPLRLTASADQTVLQWLQQLHRDQTAHRGPDAASLADIISSSGFNQPEELMESLVVLENYPLDHDLAHGGGLQITDYANYERTNFGLTLVILPVETGYSIKLLGNGSRFDQAFLTKAAVHYKQAITAIMEDYAQPVAQVSVLRVQEQQALIEELCSATVCPVDNGTVHRRFEARVRQYPDKVAVVTEDSQLSYNELNDAANRMAHRLLSDERLQPGSCVGLLLLPSTEMIVAILAVMKAGGVYVPLDPHAPAERNRLVLDDCQAALLLTTAELQHRTDWQGKQLFVHTDNTEGPVLNPDVGIASTDLAYILYTSGSTGKPKGVMVEHRSILNLLDELESVYPLLAEDTFLLKTSYTFDVSVTELFGWFIGCGRLAVLAPGKEKSAQALIQAVQAFQVTHLNVVPSMLSRMTDVLEQQPEALVGTSTLRYLFAAGEELKAALAQRFFKLGTAVRLENVYGPTECTVYATRYSLRAGMDVSAIPIGRPIRNLRCYIVDKQLRLQPPGVPGQLCLAGVGLARGYLNRAEQQRASFIPSPFLPGERLYLTGDLACMRPDGNLIYMGRADQQLKIRGFRIEAGEIESQLLTCPGVQEAVVVLHRVGEGREILCAFYRTDGEAGPDELRHLLGQKLPEYMIPAQLHPLASFPSTASGKVDRSALTRQLELNLPQDSTHARPESQMEEGVAAIWKEILRRDRVGLDDNFFDVGGNSLDLFQMNSRLEQLSESEVAATAIFQYPTIRTMAAYLGGSEEEAIHKPSGERITDPLASSESSGRHSGQAADGIAIIGMSVRLPNSDNLEQFWRNLEQGEPCISFFDDEQLIEAGADPEAIRHPNYVKAQGVMRGAELFDAEFFGYTPLEAQVMDPQARVLHEVAWETMEDAGYGSSRIPRKTAVYTSASPNLYWESLVASSDRIAILGELASEQLFNKDYLAMRLAYKLNLTGAAANVYTACSSSLVAVHQACEALLRRECEMALAGSATLSPLPDGVGYMHHEGMVKSPNGQCRAFDIDSQGFVGGTGAAAILLKREEEAIRDGDAIYAVIRASTVNNDGQLKIGYTAPSVEGIKQAVQAVLSKGNISPDSIRYVETHGAATPLGDSVEMEALTQAFQSSGRAICGIGSVKSSIGHLDCTSGIAGLVKTALALKHRTLPPTLNIRVPNPKINFIASPFYPVMEAEKWEAQAATETPVRAMTMSLGLGGTNAVVVLEEAPVRNHVVPTATEPADLLIPISARTSTALINYKERLLDHMQRNPDISLTEYAHTLASGREHFVVRDAVVCRDKGQWAEQLPSKSEPNPLNGEAASLFVLTTAPLWRLRGIYSLYGRHTVFSEALEECAAIVVSGGMRQLQAALAEESAMPTLNSEPARELPEQEALSFCLQYALVRMLLAWGIRPLHYIGDPLGRLIALTAAGPLPRVPLLATVKQWIEDRLPPSDWKLVIQQLSSGGELPSILDLDGRSSDWQSIASARQSGLSQPAERVTIMPQLSNLHPSKPLVMWEMSCRTALDVSVPVHRMPCWSEPAHAADELLLQRLLTYAGWLWEQGAELNWAAVHARDITRKVSLPAYPFERSRYWIEGSPWTAGASAKQERSLRRKEKLQEWFYAPGWTQKPLVRRAQTYDVLCMLVVGSDPLHAELAAELRGLTRDVITVEAGEHVQKLDDRRYTVTMNDASGMVALLQRLADEQRMPDHIICLWDLVPSEQDREGQREQALPDAKTSFYAAIYAAKALQQLNREKPVRMSIVASELQHVTGGETLQPLQAAVLGPLKVIPQEIPFIRCQSIDVEYPRHALAKQRLLRCLTEELSVPEPVPSVAYRNHIRYEPSYEPVCLPETAPSTSRFRHQGVYLITGGLGNIGLAIARHLAVQYEARLILVGRTVFPAREERINWLDAHTDADPRYTKVQQIVEWERQGALIHTCTADVADWEQLSGAVAEAEASFGRIHGVIHAAGSMRDSLFCTLTELTAEQCRQQFLPKLGGLLHLTALFGQRELDFLHVTSSTSSILGGLGFAAYAGANIAMDAFIREYNHRSATVSWTTANWEGWRFEGDSRPVDREFAVSELMMEPAEGVEAWVRIIHHDLPQLVVSSGDLDLRVSRWVTGLSAASAEAEKATGKNSVSRPRPPLESAYVSPANRTEEQIVEVLRQLLGYEEIGREDNFFELGASSLDMIQIASRLRSELQCNIPIVQLFTSPTVRLLAESLHRQQEPAVSPEGGQMEETQRTEVLSKGRSSLQSRYALRRK